MICTPACCSRVSAQREEPMVWSEFSMTALVFRTKWCSYCPPQPPSSQKWPGQGTLLFNVPQQTEMTGWNPALSAIAPLVFSQFIKDSGPPATVRMPWLRSNEITGSGTSGQYLSATVQLLYVHRQLSPQACPISNLHQPTDTSLLHFAFHFSVFISFAFPWSRK